MLHAHPLIVGGSWIVGLFFAVCIVLCVVIAVMPDKQGGSMLWDEEPGDEE